MIHPTALSLGTIIPERRRFKHNTMTTKGKVSLLERGLIWVLIQLVLLCGIVLIPRDLLGLPAWSDGINIAARLLGGMILFAGLVLVAISALYLGTNLTIFPHPLDDGFLTQSGIYGIVRHPMYAGVILCGWGYGLFVNSTPGLVLSLILTLFFDRKAHFEEARLRAKYPEYDQYQKRVKKLIPFIY